MPTLAARPTNPFNDHSAGFGALCQHYDDAFEHQVKRATCRTLSKRLADDVAEAQPCQGLLRLRRFEEILESGFQWRRHTMQRKWHEDVVQALAQLIVGDDWEKVGPELMRQRGWRSPIPKASMAMAPRRFGKSVGMISVVIALAEVMVDMKDFTQVRASISCVCVPDDPRAGDLLHGSARVAPRRRPRVQAAVRARPGEAQGQVQPGAAVDRVGGWRAHGQDLVLSVESKCRCIAVR